MQNFLPRVRGNERLRARLGAELAANSFSHAYLIAGPHGCGKRTLALEVAMAAACEHRDAPTLPCGKCEACRKIREGISPDVITVKKTDRQKLHWRGVHSVFARRYSHRAQ